MRVQLRHSLCWLLLLVSLPGCALLFPPSNKPVDPDKPDVVVPDDKDPDVGIVDEFKVRAGTKAAVKGIPADKILVLYGACDAMADFVSLSRGNLETTHDVVTLLGNAMDNLGWTKGAYPAWNAELDRAWAAYKFDDATPVNEHRNEIAGVLRLLALGCKDALK